LDGQRTPEARIGRRLVTQCLVHDGTYPIQTGVRDTERRQQVLVGLYHGQDITCPYSMCWVMVPLMPDYQTSNACGIAYSRLPAVIKTQKQL
jgi:hypothetical protein